MKTKSIEIFDPGSGLFVSLTAGGNGAIMLGEDVIAAAPIPATGLEGLVEGVPLELETEHGELSVSVTSTGEPIRFDGELTGRRESSLIEARGHLTHQDERVDLDCRGVIHRQAEGSPGIRGLMRDATIILADGGLICLASAAPDESATHGVEETVAAITHPGGYIEFDEVLLSTEYDGSGRQRRATLELWPATEDVAALHGAGSVVTGCTAKTDAGVISTALFRWSLDGHPGFGRYEITRPVSVAAA